MDPLKKIFNFLDRHTGFAKDLDRLAESAQWPGGWLTLHQVAEEVDRFGFWDGLRNRVPPRTRPLLLDFYLRSTAQDDGAGWVCIDDQFKFRPDHNDTGDKSTADPTNIQNRRHGRVQCEMLSCQYGEVANLSASGMMIRCKGCAQHAENDRLPLDLKCLDTELTVSARVAWLKQEDKGFQMGLEFVELTPEQAQQIRDMLPIAAAVQVVGPNAHGNLTDWG